MKGVVTEEEHKRIFDSWLSKYKALIFKIVRVYSFSTADSEDLFQEIIIQIWRSILSFRQESSASTWIYRISINTAMKWKSREQRHPGTEELKPLHALLTENRSGGDERLDWLYKEIQTLDKIDRSVTLLLLEDFSYKEIASILGISESHVGVKINRIKKELINRSKKTNHGI